MANIIIGTNTYQNIDKVKFRTINDTEVTFVDSTQVIKSPAASYVSVSYGTSGIKTLFGAVQASIGAPVATFKEVSIT